MNSDLTKDIEKQIVHTTSAFAKDNSFDDPRFMKIRCAIMHSGVNRNKSKFEKSVIEDAKDTFANIPILADVREYTDKDGNTYLDYSGHSMHIEEDKFNEGEMKVIYDEKVVGIIPETNNFEMILDDETGNYYAYADALLYRDYGNYVCDILTSRGNKTDVSVEVLCDDISFSTKDGVINVGKMTASGVTMLGDHVEPGMYGANAKVFSLDKESRDEQLIKIMQELKESLDNYINKVETFENTKEGGNDTVVDNVFEEETVKETVEETTEETVTEEMNSDETTVETPLVEEDFDEEDEVEDPGTEDIEEEHVEEDHLVEEHPDATDEVIDDDEPIRINNESLTRTFEISHDDIRHGLYTLLAEYENTDNDWYYICSVYSSYFVFQSCWTGAYFGQKYIVENDNISFDGTKYSVFAEFLTESEKTVVDEMRSNYSIVLNELDTYKAIEENSKKDALFVAKEYESISDNAEFIKLKENHTEFSYKDLQDKLDAIQLKAAKEGTLKFSVIEEPKKNKSIMFASSVIEDDDKRKKEPYGGIFKKFKNNK